MRKIAAAARQRNATPPTAPPMISIVVVDNLEDLEAAEGEDEGLEEVGLLMDAELDMELEEAEGLQPDLPRPEVKAWTCEV